MKYEEGRQGTGYLKRKLFAWNSKRFITDGWMIKYPPNTDIPPHKDGVDGKKHYRLNIVFRGRGKFEIEGKTVFNLFNRVILFRPDKYEHWMKNGDKTRMVLSFGLAL